jgi:hypothetical protein
MVDPKNRIVCRKGYNPHIWRQALITYHTMNVPMEAEIKRLLKFIKITSFQSAVGVGFQYIELDGDGESGWEGKSGCAPAFKEGICNYTA